MAAAALLDPVNATLAGRLACWTVGRGRRRPVAARGRGPVALYRAEQGGRDQLALAGA